MTLKELINPVDSEEYSDSPLFQKLRETKPEYGSNRHIEVKLLNGEVVVTNAHVGSIGDILTYPINVAPDLKITKVQLLDMILKEIASDGYTDGEQSEFWDDMTNLQKAKIIRQDEAPDYHTEHRTDHCRQFLYHVIMMERVQGELSLSFFCKIGVYSEGLSLQ